MTADNIIRAANEVSTKLLEWAVEMPEAEREQFFDSRNNWIREFAQHLMSISQDAPND